MQKSKSKPYRLELKESAILCPACRRKIRGVRLLAGAVMRNVSVMCQTCRWVGIVNIDESGAACTSD